MDLADFQVDMDMLQSMTSSQPQVQGHPAQAQEHLLDNMDYLFHQDMPSPFMHNGHNQHLPQQPHYMPTSRPATSVPSTPVYPSSAQQSDYLDQDDMLTPLISPAMTPSFTYHNGAINNEMDFSPLSSPAILPQRDQSDLAHQQRYQPPPSSTPSNNQQSFVHIREQYEQLEHAKRMITQRLSELQRQQQSVSSHASSIDPYSRPHRDPARQTTRPQPSQPHHAQLQHHPQRQPQQHSLPTSSVRTNAIEPVTPASLMNIRHRSSMKKPSQPSVTAKAAMEEMDQQSAMILDVMTTSSPSSSLPPPLPATSSSMTMAGARPAHPQPTMIHHQPPSLLPSAQPNPTETTSSKPSPRSTTSTRGKRKASFEPSRSTPAKATRSASGPRKSRRSSSYQDSAKVPVSAAGNVLHQSPRALKPLLISPSLTPDRHQALTSTGLTPQLLPTIHDAEHILATKSNYQNLMEGKAAALGIAFSPHIKSGLEVRRTAHKAAEQKRRDSLKEWFDRLRNEVEEGYVKKKAHVASKVLREQQREKQDATNADKHSQDGPDGEGADGNRTDQDDAAHANADDIASLKPLSKVLLLRYAYEYINYLKGTIRERDRMIECFQGGATITPPNALAASSTAAAPSPPPSTEPMEIGSSPASN
ncbi:hypothetical protein DM01DRAFT_1380023 [Hesseltinella vesiculosa]|uniref:BHLH domain-containing protein n=1 Tax=Hesseltinella vesiculosa TaxID=101127 RepID=A0A1X2GW04_9FUNG|nr:hypothetical protein DM01DRAFT_1380023 [Hesseltinella vesiculosa]